MKQEDTNKNEGGKIYIKIPIPAYNDYLLKDMERWIKKVYHQVRLKVNQRRAEKIKGIMPIELADYAVKKTFGNWRLVAPASAGEISPLQQVITWIRDEIVSTRWGKFRLEFVRLLKLAFNAIIESDYDMKMGDEVNARLNQLLAQYTCYADGVKIKFVLKPETARDNSSPESLQVKSRIWERFTGKPLELTKYIYDPSKGCPSGREMEMTLEITKTHSE